ncbi:hypothetical protein DMENIID0001_169070 [Sergentomyia squamirostris]
MEEFPPPSAILHNVSRQIIYGLTVRRLPHSSWQWVGVKRLDKLIGTVNAATATPGLKAASRERSSASCLRRPRVENTFQCFPPFGMEKGKLKLTQAPSNKFHTEDSPLFFSLCGDLSQRNTLLLSRNAVDAENVI